jgi:hypothetical protein
MSMYATRVCICGATFTTDCNEYTCSQRCEDEAWEREMERREKEDYLESIRPDHERGA